MSVDASNPRGWEELTTLARARGLQHVLLKLREPGAFLELLGGRADLVSVQAAPDGVYALQVSGKIVVKGGRFQYVTGTPNAAASGDPVD